MKIAKVVLMCEDGGMPVCEECPHYSTFPPFYCQYLNKNHEITQERIAKILSGEMIIERTEDEN